MESAHVAGAITLVLACLLVLLCLGVAAYGYFGPWEEEEEEAPPSPRPPEEGSEGYEGLWVNPEVDEGLLYLEAYRRRYGLPDVQPRPLRGLDDTKPKDNKGATNGRETYKR